VLVKSNDPHWVRIDSSHSLVELQGQHFPMRTTQLQGSDDERLLVWQWYWINGQMVASDYMARIYLALSRLRGRGDDAAAVIVYAPMHNAGTEIALRDFASIAVTRLPIYLRDVRDRR
jgi:EpsI family protein